MRFAGYAKWVALGVVFLACFYDLGSGPLWETDEGFAANRAGSLLRHGTVLVTYDDVDGDEPQFHKPPLIYWAVAALYKTIGYNLWAVRIPTAFFSLVLCIVFYAMTRRAFGEVVALASALLPCTVPFFLGHVRTAMLDLPLAALSFLAIWGFAYRGDLAGAVLAGLCAGAAVMTKGPAGLMALVSPLIVRLATRSWNRALLRDTLLLVVLACLPALIYLALLPPDIRAGYIASFTEHQVGGRLSANHGMAAMEKIVMPFMMNLGWHAVAAVFGLVVALSRWREPEARRWIWLFLAIALPVGLVVKHEVVPYARYLLPVYPLVVALSALFCLEAPRRAWSACLLVAFAAACVALDSSAHGLVVAAAALGAAAVYRFTRLDGTVLPMQAAGLVLLLVVSGMSFLSPHARGSLAHDRRWYRPEAEVLARAASELVPAGEKLVVGGGNFKLHNILFHGQRAVESFDRWLLQTYRTGVVRYGIFDGPYYGAVPHLRTTVLRKEGTWTLVRMEPEPGDEEVLAIAVVEPKRRPGLGLAFDLLRVRYVPHALAFVITGVEGALDVRDAGVVCEQPEAPGGGLAIRPGEALTWTLPRGSQLAGVELVKKDKARDFAGLRIEVWDDASAEWRTAREWHEEPELGWRIDQGRAVRTRDRALHVRIEPVPATRVRIARVGGGEIRLAKVNLFVTAP